MRTGYARETAGPARFRFLRQGNVQISQRTLVRLLECGARFFLGGVLAGAQIFGGFAPFGLGFVAASGVGLEGLSALLGVSMGSLLFLGFAPGLKYVAASILIFSAAFAFYDTKIYRRAAFMPVTASFMTFCTGFVYLSESGWFTAQTVFFATEVLLAGASAYFYRIALRPETVGGESQTLRQTVSVLLLVMSVLIALSGVTLMAGISLGRLAATVAVLTAAYRGGLGMGSAMGISAGLAMDVAASGAPLYSMVYAFSGLITGIFYKQGRLFCALAYVLASVLSVLWNWDSGLRAAVLYETVTASVIFLLLPESAFQWWDAVFRTAEEDGRPAARALELGKLKLEKSAAAFRELYETIGSVFGAKPENDSDVAVIFDRTASRVCRKCALASACWEKDYVTTFNALNDAAPGMMERGKGVPEDFPRHFSGHCLHFPRFLNAANEELTALIYRRQFGARLKESRNAVFRQYADLSGILTETAAELTADAALEPRRERLLQMWVKNQGVSARAVAYSDAAGRFHAEIEGENVESLQERAAELSGLLGVPLDAPRLRAGSFGQRLVLLEAEPLTASVGLASARKGGEEVCGDCGSFFKTEEGMLYLALSDGMGTGEEAARESGATVRLLERFLQAGIEPEPALRTINSALSLRSEEGAACTTVDLFRVNLFSGEAAAYKYGAAPTYIRRAGKVSRVSGGAMPAGSMGTCAAPDMTRLKLEAGDWAVVVSDGLADGRDDGWLREILSAHCGEEPAELARLLLKTGAEKRHEEDDMTVLALRLAARPEE